MAELTAELIADMPNPEEIDLSPDGRFVVYVLATSGKREEHPTSALWVAATDGSRPPRQFTSGTAQDRSPRWSPDGGQIAFLSDRATRGTAQLYLMPADGGEARALTTAEHKKGVDLFAWSPSGGQIAFTSVDEPDAEDERREKERDDANVYGERWPYARLRLISLASREVTTLVGGERHVNSFSWSPDDSQIAYVTQKTPELDAWITGENEIERITVAGGEPRRVCRFPCGVESLTWASDGQTLLFEGPVAGKGQSSRAVYAVAAAGGAPTRIALGEESCAGGLRQPPHASRAVVMALEGLTTRVCWLDHTSGTLETIWPTAVEEQAVDLRECVVVQTTAGGETVLATVRGAAQQPWEVWAARAERGAPITSSQQISTHQTALAGITFGSQEPFFWSAPDGLALDGVLIRPPDALPERPLPTVVLVHGGPYWRWGTGFHVGWGNWAQWLALAGYAVLLPNPRGGMGHGERFAGAARGDVGGADFGDVMAAVDAAIERGIADPERLGIGGWSQGGFMSAWAVTQTRRFKAAIVGAGPTDWGMMTLTSDLPGFERELGESVPWDGVGPHRHAALSPISFARAVTTPVLLLHGQNDERVPVSQAIGFHRALRDVGVPTELVVYPREPHGIAERAHQIDLLRRVRAWYDRWLHP